MDLCIFIGANRDFLFLSLSPSPFLSLSLFLFLPAQIDDQNHCTRVDALHGMKIEMGKETEPFDIFHPRFNGASIKRPREFEARAARPLFYERVDSCLYRISDSYRGGVTSTF